MCSISRTALSPNFEDEFGINIYQEKYHGRGTSKDKSLRSFITSKTDCGREGVVEAL
jgi:hypothetical protein